MMNTLKTLSAVVFSLFTFGVATAQEEGLIPVEGLPAKARSFIKEHFATNSIVSVWQDTEKGVRSEYTVLFANGTEVEFYPNGEWDEVKARSGEVPAKIVHHKISKYVQKNFPRTIIKEIKKGRTKYEVNLSNGIELIFNLKGKFIKIDD